MKSVFSKFFRKSKYVVIVVLFLICLSYIVPVPAASLDGSGSNDTNDTIVLPVLNDNITLMITNVSAQAIQKYIIVRSDDIAPWWSTDNTIYLTEYLRNMSIPVSLGVIPTSSNGTIKLGDDLKLTNYLLSIRNDSGVEISLHGLKHDPGEFLGIGQSAAFSKINDSRKIIRSAIYIDPVTFIPPYYAYDTDTLYGAVSANITYFSAGWNAVDMGHAFREFPPGLWNLPATTDMYDWNKSTLYNASVIESSCQSAMDTFNTCVIVIHHQTFVDSSNNIDQNKIKLLQDVMQWVKSKESAGVTLKTFGKHKVLHLPPPQKKYIVFRSDDIWPLTNSANAIDITEKLRAKNVPQVLSIVPMYNNLNLNNDTVLSQYIKSIKDDNTIEFALHGYNHADNEFRTMLYPDAFRKISDGANIIKNVTGSSPTVFVPPFNEYNYDTMIAANNVFNSLSTSTKKGVISSGNNDVENGLAFRVSVISDQETILHLPQTTDMYDWQNNRLNTVADIESSCEYALSKFNVCVIVLHHDTFMTNGKIDPNKLKVLTDAVDWAKAKEAAGTARISRFKDIDINDLSCMRDNSCYDINSSQLMNNVVMNPGFESGTTSWAFYTGGTGTFTASSPGYAGVNSGKISLSSANSNIQLYQTGIVLEPNTKYKLSFSAYSSTGHDMTVRLFKHGSPYTPYGPDFTANLGTDWQTFSTNLTTKGFSSTVNDGRLMFWLAQYGTAGDVYFIDNILLSRIDSVGLDITAPAASTLSVLNQTSDSVSLVWIAPGDDINTGTASQYEIRYSTYPINDANWASATKASGTPKPHIAGTSESFTINGLNPGMTYHFAMKAADEVPKWSGLSNVVSASTTVSKDTTQPSIAISYPRNNQIVSAENISVSGVASDNVALTTVEVKLNSGQWQLATGTTSWKKAVALSSGSNTIYARANDTSGNSNVTSVIVIFNPPVSVKNVLKNPGFESGKTSWNFYTGGTGTFSTSSPGYEGKNASKITIGTSNTNIQLYQYNVALEPNTKYRLSFAAYSSSGRDIQVYLHKHVSPYSGYGLDYTADLGTGWNVYTKEFTTTGFSGNVTDARFRFWLAPFAAAGDTYYIDDVRLEKITA